MFYTFTVSGKPISTNAAYRKRGFGYGLFMTEEGKSWKAQIKAEAQNFVAENKWTEKWYKSKYAIILHIYRPSNRGDVNNFDKLVLDAFQGVVYENDSQVESLELHKSTDRENPRIEIHLAPLT